MNFGKKVMLYTCNVPLGQKYNMIMRDKDEYYLYVELKEVDSIIQKWIPCNEQKNNLLKRGKGNEEKNKYDINSNDISVFLKRMRNRKDEWRK